MDYREPLPDAASFSPCASSMITVVVLRTAPAVLCTQLFAINTRRRRSLTASPSCRSVRRIHEHAGSLPTRSDALLRARGKIAEQRYGATLARNGERIREARREHRGDSASHAAQPPRAD